MWPRTADFENWTGSESFRAARKSACGYRPLYIGGPQFEGFTAIQEVKPAQAAPIFTRLLAETLFVLYRRHLRYRPFAREALRKRGDISKFRWPARKSPTRSQQARTEPNRAAVISMCQNSTGSATRSLGWTSMAVSPTSTRPWSGPWDVSARRFSAASSRAAGPTRPGRPCRTR